MQSYSRVLFRLPAIAGGLVLLAAAVLAGAAPASAGSGRHTWWVQAGAPAGGTGSLARPLNSLQQVQAGAHPGDVIFVLPAPAQAGPLDGGIALKPGQQLIGLGGPVTKLATGAPAPAIANTGTATNNGDAIDLASGNLVENIKVTSAARGGIYAAGGTGLAIAGNDLTGTNTGCASGMQVDFPPGALGPPGVTSGWPAIGVDDPAGPVAAVIAGNRVHDEACADGIDVRASGTGQASARIKNNDVSSLLQDPSKTTVLAIGLQALDTSSVRASVNGNSETTIGSDGADCEGLFTDQAGPSSIQMRVRGNTFAHGIGGPSCNGIETFISRDAATAKITVRDSSFTDDAGDTVQENNLGTGSRMDLRLDNVTVSGTTISVPEPFAPSPPLRRLTGHGDCVNEFNTGAQAVTTLTITNSRISDCGNDGIFAFASTPASAPAASSQVTLTGTTVTGAGNFGFHWMDYAALDNLQIGMKHNAFYGNANADVRFDKAKGATTATAQIDLGGTSDTCSVTGCNSFLSTPLALGTTGYLVAAGYNWWGQPDGPLPTQVSVDPSSTATYGPALTAPPG
jgi:hypothetical protein